MKKYYYYVAYSIAKYLDYELITMPHKIKTVSDINNIRKLIHEKFKSQYLPVILSFQLLRVTRVVKKPKEVQLNIVLPRQPDIFK